MAHTLVELISRYFAAVDDKRLDASVVGSTFLADGRIVRPNGAALVGHTDILEGQQQSFARFRPRTTSSRTTSSMWMTPRRACGPT